MVSKHQISRLSGCRSLIAARSCFFFVKRREHREQNELLVRARRVKQMAMCRSCMAVLVLLTKGKRQNRYNVQVKVRLKWMEVDIRLST
eukprot:scaffold43333_cov504-Skeletonema_marinoi.AAC.1